MHLGHVVGEYFLNFLYFIFCHDVEHFFSFSFLKIVFGMEEAYQC